MSEGTAATWPPACKAYDPTLPSQYGYRPNLGLSLAFVIIFFGIAAAHAFQAWRFRAIWMLFFVIGASLEALGWIARTAGHWCSYSRPLFTMQTAVLIMGPAWFQAGIYISLWVVIVLLGRRVCPVPPRTYLLTCVCFDIVCLVLQATGGGLSGAAFEEGKSTEPGTHTMLAGIIAQLVGTIVFSFVLLWVIVKGAADIKKNRPMLLVVTVMIISTAMMIMRGFYRSFELAEGWRGKLITVEKYVAILDAAPMIIAMASWIFTPPARLLRERGAGFKITGELVEKTTRDDLAVKRESSSGSTDVEG